MKRFKSKRTGLRIDSGLQAVSFSAEVRFHGKQQPAVVSVPSNQLVAMQLANDLQQRRHPYNSHFRKCGSETELPEHAKTRKIGQADSSN